MVSDAIGVTPAAPILPFTDDVQNQVTISYLTEPWYR